ncbi:MAG: helix-turn-helix domain-containing protein, partial [Rhodospirillales bacterium]|nr:helix-turn-helix domain-containing protein [Rhodospirillales bacterium]
DQEIYGEGTKAECFFKVVTGVVRLCKFLSDGRRQVMSFHFADDVFGVEAGAAHSVSAEAVCDCTLMVYRRCNLESVASGNEDIVRQMFFHAMRNADQARDHTLLLGRCTAVERVACFLRHQARHGGNNSEVVLEMSRIDIADYLGLTIETVSRTLSKLERDRVIELVTSRIIRIKSFSALVAYAG